MPSSVAPSQTDESKQWKQKGNIAFGAGQYMESIHLYSKAIQMRPQNDTYYSNRSAAYLKVGNLKAALIDARECITLNPENHKGYGREAAAYHAMKKYDKAILVYEEGLKVCKCDPHLLKGLELAKRYLHNNHTKESKTDVSISSNCPDNREHLHVEKDLQGDVSCFIKNRRQNLKNKMAEMQVQLDMLDELTTMNDKEKLDLLFSLVDSDNSGTIDSTELVYAMRKRNEELSFLDAIDMAIETVSAFGHDGDSRLDPIEFQRYMKAVIGEMNVSVSQFTDSLIMKFLFPEN